MRLSCASLAVANSIWASSFFTCAVAKAIFASSKAWAVSRLLADSCALVAVCAFSWAACTVACAWVNAISFWFCISCAAFWLRWSAANSVFNVLRWLWSGNASDNTELFDRTFSSWAWRFSVNAVFFANNSLNLWASLVKFWINSCSLIGLYKRYSFPFLVNS